MSWEGSSGAERSGLPTAGDRLQEGQPRHLYHHHHHQTDYQLHAEWIPANHGPSPGYGRSTTPYVAAADCKASIGGTHHPNHYYHHHHSHQQQQQPYQLGPPRQCRLRRSLLSLGYGVMVCTFLWIFLYTLSFSCCVGNSRLEAAPAQEEYGVVGGNTRRLHEQHHQRRALVGRAAAGGGGEAGPLHGVPRRRLEEDEDDTIYTLPDDSDAGDVDAQPPPLRSTYDVGGDGQHDGADRYMFGRVPARFDGHRRAGRREEGYEDGAAKRRWDGVSSSSRLTGDNPLQSDSSDSKNRKYDTTKPPPRRRGYGGRGEHSRGRSRTDQDAWAKQGYSRKLPNGLIIGVKKGGTRALLEFLRVHPDIRAPGPEPHFFDRNYDKGLEWYRNQMPPTLDSQLTLEKTPSYFVTKGVPGRIFNMSRDIRLIVVVRDPVTRAISDYTQSSSKRTDVKAFEQMAFLDNSTGLVDTSWGAIRIGVYAKHLERWLKYFPLTQIHFVSGERLISDPAAELAKVQDFLGLKRVITDKHFYFNSTKGFPCLKKPEGSGNPHCLGKTKGRPHPKVDPKVIKRLHDFYRPFNAKFYQMTNIDFGWP